jgi:hypothetical protein
MALTVVTPLAMRVLPVEVTRPTLLTPSMKLERIVEDLI